MNTVEESDCIDSIDDYPEDCICGMNDNEDEDKDEESQDEDDVDITHDKITSILRKENKYDKRK